MIDRIIIENFKNLRQVDLALGRMNLLIGANGSGKSNLLDALQVLQGIGNGFTISEILDGKQKSAVTTGWDGVRGGSRHACFGGDDGNGGAGDVTFEVHGRFACGTEPARIGKEKRNSDEDPATSWELLIAFSPKSGCVTRERFKVDRVIYDTKNVEGFSQAEPNDLLWCRVEGADGWSLKFQRTRPALGQLAECRLRRFSGTQSAVDPVTGESTEHTFNNHGDEALAVANLLANIQRVEPEPPTLRRYSQAAEVLRMGDRGENFAALVQNICRDKKVKDTYLSWLREFGAEEIDGVGVLYNAVGKPLFTLRENGREYPATVLSDGTLRFAALAAAFFQPDMPSLMTMEKIENNIHANRARVLCELLRSQPAAAKTQVVATTHSATFLDWLGEEDYKTTFVCKRNEKTGESRVCALADVPHFTDIMKNTPASGLFSGGWLEAAL